MSIPNFAGHSQRSDLKGAFRWHFGKITEKTPTCSDKGVTGCLQLGTSLHTIGSHAGLCDCSHKGAIVWTNKGATEGFLKGLLLIRAMSQPKLASESMLNPMPLDLPRERPCTLSKQPACSSGSPDPMQLACSSGSPDQMPQLSQSHARKHLTLVPGPPRKPSASNLLGVTRELLSSARGPRSESRLTSTTARKLKKNSSNQTVDSSSPATEIPRELPSSTWCLKKESRPLLPKPSTHSPATSLLVQLKPSTNHL